MKEDERKSSRGWGRKGYRIEGGGTGNRRAHGGRPLAALGLAILGWNGLPRHLVPLLLIGGLPALLYLPDPLVTGDHPWMVRRLVPAVIPLLAIAASLGARHLWWLGQKRSLVRLRAVGPAAR